MLGAWVRHAVGRMPHTPYSEFDQNILASIEHSPSGAVPHIPTHQDSLARLLAARQVYPSADHKDGYVTARSLAALPCFSANNLDALLAGQIDLEALEPNASIFTRYVQSLPVALQARAESLRLMVAGRPAHHRAKHDGPALQDPVHSLFLVPGVGPHAGLPGNYLFGFVHQTGAERAANVWAVHLHDNGDNAALVERLTLAAALEKLQEVLASAPFHLSELEDLGFHLN